jgi:hypothetical protein
MSGLILERLWRADDGISGRDVTIFDLDQFIADCRAALAADKSHKSVREVVARAVSEPAAILKGLGDGDNGGQARCLGLRLGNGVVDR